MWKKTMFSCLQRCMHFLVEIPVRKVFCCIVEYVLMLCKPNQKLNKIIPLTLHGDVSEEGGYDKKSLSSCLNCNTRPWRYLVWFSLRFFLCLTLSGFMLLCMFHWHKPSNSCVHTPSCDLLKQKLRKLMMFPSHLRKKRIDMVIGYPYFRGSVLPSPL